MTVITRFAPSPTGFLHIGGARTALFNYLFAKHHKGKFLLRIEDTDKARSSTQAIDAIFSGLQWLGLEWDGQVLFQSARNELYKNAAMDLLNKGQAYYCFTSQLDIDRKREEAIANKKHFIFNSPWRDAAIKDYPENIKPVIRLKAPKNGQTIIHDTLQGDVIIDNDHLDDMVLVRSDGTATYMLAVVVDDHDMDITHIIRGDDHLTNAARQIILYQAFGWSVPSMTHIPLIHGSDGAKLSKRHGALGIEAYKEMGYLPEALCNYLLRLGWSHKNDEIISKEQSIEWFNLEGLGKAPARLDFTKIDSLNAHYIRQLNNSALVEMIVYTLKDKYKISPSLEEISYIEQGLDSMKTRSINILQLVDLAKIYLVSQAVDISQDGKKIIDEYNKDLLEQIINRLENLNLFDKDNIELTLKKIAIENNIKLANIISPVRVLITGMTSSPGIFEIISIIGKENTINRLRSKV